MNRETSVYLDAARFLAALAVFFSHVGARGYGGGFLWQAVPLGGPAVVVFFVLSGFVIGYVAEKREISARDYIVARAARIYSVVIPTLLLTACLDRFGAEINPEVYKNVAQLIGTGAWSLPASLAFLHMAWGGGARIFAGSDGAYWSLGYEVVYYVIFGIGFYCRGIARVIGCIFISAVAGPHILGLFPIWLIGWASYHFCNKAFINRSLGWVIFVVSVCAVTVYVALSKTSVDLADHGILEIAQDYILAVIFSANLISFHAVSTAFSPIVVSIGRSIRWLAGATFTLYLLHVPILFFIKAVLPWQIDSWQFRVSLVSVPLCAVFFVAQFTERKKEGWRVAIDWGLGKMSEMVNHFRC